MTRHSVYALGLFALLIASCGADAGQPHPTKTLRLTGQTVTTDGAPVADASVFVFQRAPGGTRDWSLGFQPIVPTAGDSETDSRGRFEVECELPARGNFVIRVEKDGMVPTCTSGISCERYDPRAIGRLVLRALRPIDGRVLDSQGNPAPDAEVFQTGNTHERTASITDAQGRFKLEGMPDGPAAIFVRKSGFRFHGQFVQANELKVEVRLTRQTEPAVDLKTLPPILTRAEEQELSRRLVEPLWKKAIDCGDKQRLWAAAWAGGLIDPWEVRDKLGPDGTVLLDSSLYRSNPDDALALFETDLTPAANCRIYLRVLSGMAAGDRQRRLELLDRAARHARSAPRPEERINCLSEVAIALFDLGETDRAKELAVNLVNEVPDISSDVIRGRIADALALVDPEGAIRMAQSLRDPIHFERFSTRVAYRLAETYPSLVQSQIRGIHARAALENIAYRLDDRRYAWSYNNNDLKIVGVCYRMAKVDSGRALAIARSLHCGLARAYAKGMIALAIAPRDRGAARTLLLDAFAELEQPNRALISRLLDLPEAIAVEECVVAAGLLPVAEAIDPALVRELFWRCIALRPSARSVSFACYFDDVFFAELVARYDRSVASILLQPRRARIAELAHDDGFYVLGEAMALIDPNNAPVFLEEIPLLDSDDPYTNPRLTFAGDFAGMMAKPVHSRWLSVMAGACLWRPEPEVIEDFALHW